MISTKKQELMRFSNVGECLNERNKNRYIIPLESLGVALGSSRKGKVNALLPRVR